MRNSSPLFFQESLDDGFQGGRFYLLRGQQFPVAQHVPQGLHAGLKRFDPEPFAAQAFPELPLHPVRVESFFPPAFDPIQVSFLLRKGRNESGKVLLAGDRKLLRETFLQGDLPSPLHLQRRFGRLRRG